MNINDTNESSLVSHLKPHRYAKKKPLVVHLAAQGSFLSNYMYGIKLPVFLFFQFIQLMQVYFLGYLTITMP